MPESDSESDDSRLPPWILDPSEEPFWIPAHRACSLLRVSKTTLYRWIDTGILKDNYGIPSFRFGGKIFVRLKPFHLARQRCR